MIMKKIFSPEITEKKIYFNRRQFMIGSFSSAIASLSKDS